MRTKSISVSRILDFRRCPKSYFDAVTGRREVDEEQIQFEVRGDATHKLAAGESTIVVREFVEREMSSRPVEEREAVIAQAVEMSKTAEAKREPEVTKDAIERQMVLEFEGWKIYAKPDRIFFFDERQANGSFIKVLQITELKSSVTAKPWHWAQLYLFAFVAIQVLNWHGPVRLVVSPLQGGEDAPDESRGYSHWRTADMAEALRTTLRAIETCWETREFPCNGAGHCHGCKSKASCPVGQAVIELRQAQREEESRRMLPSFVPRDAALPVVA